MSLHVLAYNIKRVMKIMGIGAMIEAIGALHQLERAIIDQQLVVGHVGVLSGHPQRRSAEQAACLTHDIGLVDDCDFWG